MAIPFDIFISGTLGFALGFLLLKRFKQSFAFIISTVAGALAGWQIVNALNIQDTSAMLLLSTQMQILIAANQITTLSQLVQYANISMYLLVLFNALAAMFGFIIAFWLSKRHKVHG